jgi:sugar lactone lactonase YvrE
METRRGFLIALRAVVVGGVALVVTWLAMPSPIGSVAWIPSPAPALDGPYRMNTALQSTVTRFPALRGAEDVVVTAGGQLITGLADGRLVRLDGERVIELGQTGGRPLGLALSPTDGQLYVADGTRGLLRVDPSTGRVEALVDSAEGSRFRCTNDVVVARDGMVYFTDSSGVWRCDQLFLDLLDQRPTGRVLRFDPQTQTTTVLVRELHVANGLALMPDERSLIVGETGRYRLWRLFLEGEKRNLKEVFVENLPGFPDKLSISPRGTVWVAMASTRKRLLDAIHPSPFFKDAIATLPTTWQPRLVRWGFVLELDGSTGAPLRSLQDPTGDVVPHVSSAVEHDGNLWLGRYDSTGLGIVSLSPP